MRRSQLLFTFRCCKYVTNLLLLEIENQVLTLGALHQADSTALQLASCAWHAELAHLMEPLLVVNIGGPTSNSRYSELQWLLRIKCLRE